MTKNGTGIKLTLPVTPTAVFALTAACAAEKAAYTYDMNDAILNNTAGAADGKLRLLTAYSQVTSAWTFNYNPN